MLSPQALFRGLVSRALPVPNVDSQNTDVAARQWTYGEVATQPLIRKSHALADEGSYFLANNGVTAVNRNIGTAFSATLAQVLIQNNSSALRMYLDYIAINAITATTQASGAAVVDYALILDTINRYTSGGTQILPFSPNMAIGNPTSIATIYSGPIVAPAASANVRTVIGTRILRPAASATALSVVGDMVFLNFGGVEMSEAGSITIANASIIPHSCPPVVLGPGHTALLHLWLTGSTTPVAGTDIYEVGFWMR